MKPTDSSGPVKGGADAVLTVAGLGVGFFPEAGRRLEVVAGVDLCLRAGRTTALVGESGCGKSLTAAALGGLLPRGMKMDQGEIRWADGGPRGPGRGLAYVFQDPGECLDPVFTIGNQIREALLPAERGRAEDRLLELLRTVGFDDPERVRTSYPHQLSGGMQQRLAIARALLHDPAVLLLDEPFTGLDETSSQILDRIIHEAAAGGKMVLLATHDLERACSAGTRMDLLHSGRIAHSESTSTFTPESLSRLLHEISNKPLASEQNRGAA